MTKGRGGGQNAAKGNPVLHTYGTGGTFGELALLYNAPRAATVTCIDAGLLWTLDSQSFRAIMLSQDASAHLDTTDSGGARITDRERPFTAQNLKGWI